MTQLSVPARDALRMIGAGPVVFITSMYRNQPNVMTAGWLLPISLDPTLIGVAIQPSRMTHEFITRTAQFGISIPTMDQLAAVHGCGMASGRDGDKFEQFALTPQDPTEIEAPWILESLAHIECGVTERISIGDHDLFVGHVLDAAANESAFDATWKPEDDVQLVHHLGGERYSGMSRAYLASAPPEGEDER